MKKKIILILITIFLTITLIYAADRMVANKFNKIYAGWNFDGYRGILKSDKKKNFKRIVTVGGSTTFGYGTTYDYAWPFLLEQKFNKDQKKVDIANLGHLAQGIWAIKRDLKYYEYLDYDYVIFYSGYNDVNQFIQNKNSARHYNLFFKLFGYLPILNIYIYEKVNLIIHGNLDKFYSDKAKKSKDDEDETTGKVIFSLDEKSNPVRTEVNKSYKCFENMITYEYYFKDYKETFEYLLKNNKKIIFIHQPLISNLCYFDQKKTIKDVLGKYPEIVQLDYNHLIDLTDLKLSLDYMHLTAEGNSILANKLYEDIKKIFEY